LRLILEVTNKQTPCRIDTGESQHAPDSGQLPRRAFAHVDGARSGLPQRHKQLPPRSAQHERHVPRERQDLLDVGVPCEKRRIPRTRPDDQASPAETLVQKVHRRGQHDHVAQPPESEDDWLQWPDRNGRRACWQLTGIASVAGKLERCVSHSPEG
jgi:hypothetical protein